VDGIEQSVLSADWEAHLSWHSIYTLGYVICTDVGTSVRRRQCCVIPEMRTLIPVFEFERCNNDGIIRAIVGQSYDGYCL
jgi:hypothetical protein